jgi:glucuronate isomerase
MSFIHDDFLLTNKFAKELYHDYAKDLPIIDYHCHLPPEDIANDRNFENLTQIWLNGDHYKWRGLRTLGVDEKYITGNATDAEKFLAWGKSVPHTMRNPLYHWTHLELSRYFGITDLLNDTTAPAIYKKANELLVQPEYSTKRLIEKMKVEVICTTDDPIDDLKNHKAIAKSGFKTKVNPSFRPDKSIGINQANYNEYIDQLAKKLNREIDSFQDLCSVLKDRVAYFNSNGCKVSDHGLNSISFIEFTEAEVENIFKKRRKGEFLNDVEDKKFQSALLLFLGETYHEYGWIQQYHLGPLRNNNSRMLKRLGPDTGWDSMGDERQAEGLSKFLDRLDSQNKLTKTILYNLNPAFNEVFATMIGNFNDGSIRGKVQWGSGWWFLDQKDGMTKQINALSNMGLISCFIGMLTDSRSFMSYPRHEYFRRIICNIFGSEIESGELPNDMKWIGKMVSNIAYHNAKEYFQF